MNEYVMTLAQQVNHNRAKIREDVLKQLVSLFPKQRLTLLEFPYETNSWGVAIKDRNKVEVVMVFNSDTGEFIKFLGGC